MTQTDARVADIRRWAKQARMTNFGEKHVLAGTSSARFYDLIIERLQAGASRDGENQRDLAKGADHWRKVLGRDTADAPDTAATKDKDNEEDDEDREDDVDGDDPDDEGDAKKKPADEDAKRGARAWRKVADKFGLGRRTEPARNSARR